MKEVEVLGIMKKVHLLRDDIEETLENFVIDLEDRLADMIE